MDYNFKNDAKSIIDLLFNTKCFREDISRDNMNELENYVEFCLSSKFEAHIKCLKLSKQIERLEKYAK